MKRFLLFLLLVALVLAGVSLWNQHRRRSTPAQPGAGFTPAAPSRRPAPPTLSAADRETTDLLASVIPSVVSITTVRRTPVNVLDLLMDFRPHRLDPKALYQHDGNLYLNTRQSALGSGVIVSREGHILTNHHVVANVDAVFVHMSVPGPPLPARVIGSDEKSDIAVIKIETDAARPLAPLPLGDSDQVRVGQLIFAIGNPFGWQETVTSGIISAKGRETSENVSELFQIEAAINPGNSGGPLINIRGEVIGINMAIDNQSGSGTWQGVGFAIPSNVARMALEEILKHGRVVRGYLGVVSDLLPPVPGGGGFATGQPPPAGLVIRSVDTGSPAEKAGLKAGDLLQTFNGRPIRDFREIVRRLATLPAGSRVAIGILRGQKPLTLQATLVDPPAAAKNAPQPTQSFPSNAPGAMPEP